MTAKNKCKNEEKKSRTIEYSRWSRWTLKKINKADICLEYIVHP